MPDSKRYVLVTGGAGYIGSHTCKALHKAGYLPISYDNLVYGHEWAVKWGPLERGEISDRERLNAVIELYRPAAVIHFAAFAYVGESVVNPGKYYRNNVADTLALVEAVRDHQIKSFVFSSTCATYGVPERLPISESAPQHPINPYGASKLMVERILADFTEAHGLRSIALRYFNAAGADPDGEIGEDHNPETHLVPLVLDAAAGRRSNITVYGTDYPTPDGTCIRDYIHVTDLAEAHVKALERLHYSNIRLAYNLGTGRGVSVRNIIDSAMKVTGRTIPVVMGERRPGDPPELVADPTFANNELGWVPIHSSIDMIVRTAWQWQSQHFCTDK